MAVTSKLLHLRPHLRPIQNPSLSHFFSSSTTNNDPTPNLPPQDPTSSKSTSFAAYFRDVKASLNSHPSPPKNRDPDSKISSSDDIRKNLSEYRRLSESPQPARPISFLDLYKRNDGAKAADDKGKGLGFGAIRESLKNLQAKNPGHGTRQSSDLGSYSLFNEALNSKLGPKKSMVGGSESLPSHIFGREVEGKGEGLVDDALRGEFFKSYTSKDLGMKLMKLRPEKKKDERNWFSMQELSERLHKLRVIDEKEMESGPKSHFTEIRASLVKIVKSDMEKKGNINVQRIDLLNNLGTEEDYMLSAPKEELLENYYHPDHMSSAEKLKIELKNVRDEFKISESDCGSARVQVAQLTTKIKHLSTALHKKDKHSRKGLQGMVQRRKKLLKYLRRTDWDSYCLVLSKLGLRDNPDYKN